jgi:hypothetical protein
MIKAFVFDAFPRVQVLKQPVHLSARSTRRLLAHTSTPTTSTIVGILFFNRLGEGKAEEASMADARVSRPAISSCSSALKGA